MGHSKNYEKFKGYFEQELWTLDMLWNVVGRKFGITEDEYNEITGFVYPNKE